MQNQQGRKNWGENPKLQRGSKSHSPQHYSVDNFRLSLNLYFLPLTLLLLVGLFSCGNPPSQKPNQDNSATKDTDSKLTFFGVALEQFDEQGRPIWKVKAQQAKYTREQEIGEAKNPEGELYQDGKIVYTIKAETADIKQDGKQLLLKGKILAQDPRTGVTLRGNELEWRPEEDLLIVRNQLNGSHKQLKAVAQEARVKTREQRVDFSGKVVAISADPPLQIRTESLTWQVKEEKLIGDRPIEINRYQDNKITDRGRGNSAEINLKTKIATLQPKAQLELINPPMQITSNSMTWDIKQEIVKTNASVRVFHKAENVTVTGNQAEMKIPQKIVYLTGNVNALGKNNQSLKSNQLTWNLDQKLLEAKGNVFYTQVEPPLKFQGTTAVGNLETENIVVKGGGSGKRVVTEIIPQD
ncbi:LPS export ABC transporter periplasmic protein LptC [Okeanomitos corallinicola TIOX110]|uniref:LPS export ABC transporter periplasmic protein LptC n=1 Tax=Okeanomitos corallinicola TIOX110 TaxID=3133117 RepID=A0ABZ2UNM1_9CYAN